jgi:hypothetical protein
MKTPYKINAVFLLAKGNHEYYSFEDFTNDAKAFIKDVKKRNTICTIKASRSGMSRKFNFDRYNMLLNICYNQKFSFDPVAVGGCGMDMHWHLKYSTCEALLTKNEIEKHRINLLCSSGKIL